ncbi:A disintegrin and metalloproteinase with thrombospondin motifs 18 isoform X2 [Eurytemora carolleeae]|uniref:A disintegrin and metalloproteinase with thrombospondin motifs 18 isoform X2 n=1 Tax=Eurytemora carolleeae TaxID=1294199 RepID=UPI000C788091|nr:A disintegrin and metalloproteinase with thrombospondin motifs 18 isoform X2 [Eurytemora carolleeae]|eukprot:XP_023320697.1 A disintegrin and metalloproteinase with thrombospondin motifs 18-like isoform X2 [Eurytemora affinis]
MKFNFCFPNLLLSSLLLLPHIQTASFPDLGFFQNDNDWDAQDLFIPKLRRRKRSTRDADSSAAVEFKFTALGRKFDFSLTETSPPLTNHSVLMVRRDDSTDILDLSSFSQSCLYKGVSRTETGEKMAINLCAGFRGVLTSETDYYVIKPLAGGSRKEEWREGDGRRGRRKKRDLEYWTPGPHLIFRKAKWKEPCAHSSSDLKQNKTTNSDFSRVQRRYLQVHPDTFIPNSFKGEERIWDDHLYFPNGGDESRTRPEPGYRDSFYPGAAKPELRPQDEFRSREKYFMELAVFIDRDLHRYMAENFPLNTDENIVQVVLAIINAVELLYSDPSLGVNMKFLIKRLEILQADPPGLVRSYDIDRYLHSFCQWQMHENPPPSSELNWDHALVLTGLDVHVVDRSGKLANQVVGLAPVSGMCNAATSCTVNEGRHFESVYVMAHEIGHNLGMNHDGPESNNDCSPGDYIMSPTLGSGKIRWSSCSRKYLRDFLSSSQAFCLKDEGKVQLEHSFSPEKLPGERFPADLQCKLRYGPKSTHAHQQNREVCRDLHCRREHFTWTSHPALEGTSCGSGSWCKRGVCVSRNILTDPAISSSIQGEWSDWTRTECSSPCLYPSSGYKLEQDDGSGPRSLVDGSSGIIISSRTCSTSFPQSSQLFCPGSAYMYSTCSSVKECMSVPRASVLDYSRELCTTASHSDADILPFGDMNALDNPDPDLACRISCFTIEKRLISKNWFFPDGTRCYIKGVENSFCIHGVCEKFSCLDPSQPSPAYPNHAPLYSTNKPEQIHILDPSFCTLKSEKPNLNYLNTDIESTRLTRLTNFNGGSTPVSWSTWSAWRPDSKCVFSCLVPARGLQMMSRRCEYPPCTGLSSTISICEDISSDCSKLQTPFQFASQLCARFQLIKLSGIGMQLSSTDEDPDRGCRIACQDSSISYRFYMVSGEKGWYPDGTDCRSGESRSSFCVKGRCLEFGDDGTPLYFHQDTGDTRLRRRSLFVNSTSRISGSIDQSLLEQIVQEFNKTLNPENIPAQKNIKTSHDRKITFQIDQFDQTDQLNLTDQADQFHPLNQTENPKQPDILINFQNPVDVTDTADYMTAEEYILLERNQNRFSSRQSWEYLEYNEDDDILDDVTILFKDGRNEIEFNSSLSTKVQFVLEIELLLLLFLLL